MTPATVTHVINNNFPHPIAKVESNVRKGLGLAPRPAAPDVESEMIDLLKKLASTRGEP